MLWGRLFSESDEEDPSYHSRGPKKSIQMATAKKDDADASLTESNNAISEASPGDQEPGTDTVVEPESGSKRQQKH